MIFSELSHQGMAFQTNCPHCEREMTATGGDIGTVCLCVRCGAKFAVYTSGARVCAADAKVGDNVEVVIPAKVRKRRTRLLLAVISVGLIVLGSVAVSHVRSTIAGIRLRIWEGKGGFDPNDPKTPKQREERDREMTMVCMIDHFFVMSVLGFVQGEGISEAEITRLEAELTRYIGEIEKIDVTRCPDDFRAARVEFLAALRQFALGKMRSGGAESESGPDAKAALVKLYRLWNQMEPALKKYRQMLERYQIKVDFKPLEKILREW